MTFSPCDLKWPQIEIWANNYCSGYLTDEYAWATGPSFHAIFRRNAIFGENDLFGSCDPYVTFEPKLRVHTLVIEAKAGQNWM